MIWASLHVLIGVLSFLNACKYHPCWCIPLALLTTLMWMMWGGSFAGIIISKHYLNKADEICPPSDGSGWEKIDNLYLTASSLLCHQACPCNEEYARLYTSESDLVFAIGGANTVLDCPGIDSELTPDQIKNYLPIIGDIEKDIKCGGLCTKT